MRRSAFVSLSLTAIATLASALLATSAPVALPSVDAGPPVRPVVDVAQPEDAAELEVLHYLQERHTGLAAHELGSVAEIVVREAKRNQLDPHLVLAVIRVESGGYNFAVSHVGAYGFMQLMPPTGEEMARKLDVAWHGADSLFDPAVNIRLGTAYLKKLADRYDGDMATALAAYNWGPGRIDRRLRRGASVPSLYVRQVEDARAALVLAARS